MINCARCKNNKCYKGEGCSSGYDFSEFTSEIEKKYIEKEDKNIWETASKIEAEHYMQWTRLEELIGFCNLMGYKKIGIALCIGLISEASILEKILKKQFLVTSVCCKHSGLDKKKHNLKNINNDTYEAACDPIGQAYVLNKEKTDLNIIVGLCIGHDILFSKHSEAPVTTFIVKDRVLGHNPVASLYSGYYLKKMNVK